jgi:hypothetical protein
LKEVKSMGIYCLSLKELNSVGIYCLSLKEVNSVGIYCMSFHPHVLSAKLPHSVNKIKYDSCYQQESYWTDLIWLNILYIILTLR